MDRIRLGIAFVGFAVFLHCVRAICATMIVQHWNGNTEALLNSAYGYFSGMFFWPTALCLTVGLVALLWPGFTWLRREFAKEPNWTEVKQP